MKRITVTSVVLCLMVAFVAGTAFGSNASLTYRLWDVNQVPAMEQIIAEFNAIHPGISISIEVTPFAQYWTSLETAATGRNLPDIFWMNAPNFLLYASNNMLLPVQDWIENSSVDLGHYPTSLLDLYSYNGKLMGIPKDFDTIGLWYNKELFDQKGVPYPTNDWTWEDLTKAAILLTDASNHQWGFAAYQNNQSGYYNTIWQAGGYVISEDGRKSGYDDPKTIAGLRFWTDFIHVHKASPTLAQMTDTPAIALFEAGRVAMFTSGSWNQIRFAQNEYTRERVGVVALPKGEQNGVTIHGLSYVVSAHTKHPEEAKKFQEFLGSRRAHEIQAQTGTVIPAYEEVQYLWVQSNPYFDLQVFIDQVAHSVPYPRSLLTQRWLQLETDTLTLAFAGEISIEEAAKQLAQRMNGVLSQERR